MLLYHHRLKFKFQFNRLNMWPSVFIVVVVAGYVWSYGLSGPKGLGLEACSLRVRSVSLPMSPHPLHNLCYPVLWWLTDSDHEEEFQRKWISQWGCVQIHSLADSVTSLSPYTTNTHFYSIIRSHFRFQKHVIVLLHHWQLEILHLHFVWLSVNIAQILLLSLSCEFFVTSCIASTQLTCVTQYNLS